MDIQTVVYAALVLFVAYLVRGIAGFGSGLIAVPMLTLVAPVPLVVPLVVSLDYIGSASQGMQNRDYVAWKEQLVPLCSWASAQGCCCCTPFPLQCCAKCSRLCHHLCHLPALASPCPGWLAALGDPVWLSRRVSRDLVWHGWTFLRDVPQAQRPR